MRLEMKPRPSLYYLQQTTQQALSPPPPLSHSSLSLFYRTWKEYRSGFGSAGEGEWFYGLANLHALTYRQPYELQVYMHDIEQGYFGAKYTTFRLDAKERVEEGIRRGGKGPKCTLGLKVG